mmetsp:Transcript_34043/g.67110  ORF Transcript_34043/g.67110 Transcript_34043/m.67110 type:complete len:279 (-) Transcript_34043:40-876(-)
MAKPCRVFSIMCGDLYLVVDASAAVREKVLKHAITEKQNISPVKGQVVANAIKQRVVNRLANFAADKVSPSQIAVRMSNRLVKILPYRMKEIGISIIAEKVFLEGPYFVLELQIKHVDMKKFLEEAPKLNKGNEDDDCEEVDLMAIKESELDDMIREQQTQQSEHDTRKIPATDMGVFSAPSNGILEFIGLLFFTLLGMRTFFFENRCMPVLAQSKIRKSLGDMLNMQFEKKELKIDSATLEEEKQARYFYSQLKKAKSLRSRGNNIHKTPMTDEKED